MFLKVTRKGYTQKGGEQFCHGDFLIVFDHPDDKNHGKTRELRCLVRHVRMKQLGHWMMARVKINGFDLSLSGTYGGDGLPILTAGNADKAAFVRGLWDRLHPMPPEILALFWGDNGHNSSGKNGPDIQAWAKANMAAMKALKEVEVASGTHDQR